MLSAVASLSYYTPKAKRCLLRAYEPLINRHVGTISLISADCSWVSGRETATETKGHLVSLVMMDPETMVAFERFEALGRAFLNATMLLLVLLRGRLINWTRVLEGGKIIFPCFVLSSCPSATPFLLKNI